MRNLQKTALAFLFALAFGVSVAAQSIGKLAYTDGGDIWMMDGDGSNRVRVVDAGTNDVQPSWSPDGSKIAFKSDRDIPPGRGLYVVNADGTGLTLLTNAGINDSDSYPTWSPDGAKIAFASNRDNIVPSIYVMNADGSNVTRLTNQSPYSDAAPSWSPDGTRIVFETNQGLCGCIAVVNANGTGRTLLGGGQFPKWSPDSTKILFSSGAPNGSAFQLFTMNAADGANRTQLTNGTFNDYYPAWKSDGLRIAFIRNTSGQVKLWTMNADGSGQTNITSGIANAGQGFPDWRRDIPPFRVIRSALASGGGQSSVGPYVLTATSAQVIAGTISTTTRLSPETARSAAPAAGPFLVVGGFWQSEFAPPTAAGVNVSGRVVLANGDPIPNATLMLSDSGGTPRVSRTNPLGYFEFTDIPAGDQYILTATHRTLLFAPRLISVQEDVTDLSISPID